MALEFKTPTDVAEEYLVHLQSLKPSVNRDQIDSDWFVRSRVVGGVVSGVYSDQRALSRDIFPQSAREEAVDKHLETWFDEGLRDPQKAQGLAAVTGTIGTTLSVGLEMVHLQTSNAYKVNQELTLAATTEFVNVESVDTGQDQNLLEGALLQISSPPAGLESTAVVSGGDLSDGRNKETKEEGAERVLARMRSPLDGGKEEDYRQFAIDADPAVTSSKVLRHPFGLGTVGIVITSGTTDIDAAIDAGIPIVKTPSQALIDTVQSYIDVEKPLTDCAFVDGPSEVSQDVTVGVRFASGTKDTILAGQTLTQGELVDREVQRAIHKTPVGGRKLGASGYVVASDIEETIDINLSTSPNTLGSSLQIVSDRQVEDLSASGPNRLMLGNEVAKPGFITILEF